MSNSLIIVESPAKARTIGRFFNKDTRMAASMGHIRDLPERRLGIDVKNGFQPDYVLTAHGKKVINNLRREVASAEKVFLATDPDREGEAIAWHLKEVLAPRTKADFHRVSFHEITDAAVKKAFANVRDIDQNKVDAQQARRILDRLVGYKVSPLLWKQIGRGTSAGRVQSVALRLVCEREREILDFKSEEYWNLTAHFSPLDREAVFPASLFKLDGRKPEIPSAEKAALLAEEIERQSFIVSDRIVRPRQQRAAPPFITSTLQQLAGARLRMTTRQTMVIAQHLYEGLELGESGATGLITYMRTDSFAVAGEAQKQTREYIREQFGADYVPEKANVYRARQAAQEAHEAIRPTDVRRTPEAMAKYLNGPQLNLYRMIWQRFVASQMAPAKLLQTSLEVKPEAADLEHDYLFRTTVTETIFPGFMRVFQDQDIESEENGGGKKLEIVLPDLGKGDNCRLIKLEKEQAFTQPPKRFSEATLVRELEQNGVGRPSTYSSIVNTIQDRKYAQRDKGRLIPTDLGFNVNDYLVERMDRIFQINFTAEMENQLDAIEEGRENMAHMLDKFYRDFVDSVTDAELLDAPERESVEKIISIFQKQINWRQPVKVGKRTYDDQKFLHSLKEQLEKKEKPLSDKQWRALLALAARYSDQLPELEKVSEELGIVEEMRQLIANREKQEQQGTQDEKTDPAVETLFEALSEVKWQDPQKRGGRVYDDEKFFQSLKKQKEGGRKLSTAQIKALVQLASRYREQIDSFDQLIASHGLQSGEKVENGRNALSDAEKETVEKLLGMAGEILEWKPARKVRGRTFDDREFVQSLQQQWKTKGTLSPRQINALRKILSRYRGQIADYEKKAKEFSLPEGKEDGNGENAGQR